MIWFPAGAFPILSQTTDTLPFAEKDDRSSG